MTSPKLKVGILGATGMVGQRFIQLLEQHPFFQIYALGGFAVVCVGGGMSFMIASYPALGSPATSPPHHASLLTTTTGASERSAGKTYAAACGHWKMDTAIPDYVATMSVLACDPVSFAGCDLVFSGLDSSVAGEIGRCRPGRGGVFSPFGAPGDGWFADDRFINYLVSGLVLGSLSLAAATAAT